MRRSQTSTEYLIILAVVIVIAVVVIGVMWGIPGIGGGVSEKTARVAMSSARIGVINYAISDYDTVLRLRNNLPNNVQIDSIILNGEECVQINGFVLKAGEEKTVTCLNRYEIIGENAEFILEIGYTDLTARAEFLQSGQDLVLVGKVSEKYLSILDNHPSYSFSQKGCWNATTNPHPICTCYDLNRTRSDLSANYTMQNSIDFDRCMNTFGDAGWISGEGWEPIGSEYIGIFDGADYIIGRLYINRPSEDNIGLFASLFAGPDRGSIIRVGLTGVNVTGNDVVGGLVGVGDLSTITDCYSIGSISGNNKVGGVVGNAFTATIDSCYSEGSVSGTARIGGLAGDASSATITNCHSTGSVSGTSVYVGGLMGVIGSGTVDNSYSTGSVSGTNYVGGLIGYSAGTTDNSYSTSSVAGEFAVGGLVGMGGDVTNSYSAGTVNCSGSGGMYFCGGLIGMSGGSITSSSWTNYTDDDAIACVGEMGSIGGTNPPGCTVRT